VTFFTFEFFRLSLCYAIPSPFLPYQNSGFIFLLIFLPAILKLPENGLGGLPQFMPLAGEDSVKVTGKFVGKGVHFQQTESSLSLKWKQWG
jgi:hypothetical protein